jgi:uncharacterized membrane protein
LASWLFLVIRQLRRLWVTATLYSALGLMAALLSARLGAYVPTSFALSVGSDSVESILGILASSMLAVATFSLTTLVTAYTSVSANVSPRAAELLVTDATVRHALGSFVGAFLYSIVGIVAVHTGYYGSQGRVILFFITVGVIVLVVVAMLRWIGELSTLAQTRNVVWRVAQAVGHALAAPTMVAPEHARAPAPGAQSAATDVVAERAGFVQNIDMPRLRKLARAVDVAVDIVVLPGDFVRRGQPLLRLGRDEPGCARRLRSCVNIGPRRTFDQDAAFGMEVLGEIAARALSPGVNDAGTARDVAATICVLIAERDAGLARPQDPDDRVTLPPLSWPLLLDGGLGPIVTDGSGDGRLQASLQQALSALAEDACPSLADAARRFSRRALRAALASTAGDDEREGLICAAAAVLGAAEAREIGGGRSAPRPRPAAID